MSLIGAELAGYRLQKKLAEGGMGEVYLAEHTTLGRKAAVKVLRLEHCRDPASVDRFLHEAQAVNAIGDAGIVDIYDFGRDADGRAFFVMELLEGEPLSRRIARGALPWRDALAVTAGIVKPLAAAHDKGFVHRDLKPDNVWLSYDPFDGKQSVKLLDFGIAKLIGGEGGESPQAQLTRTGAVIGTPHYMAPEQIGGKPVDARTDVYALGVILYEMLRGTRPFGGDNLSAILMAHILDVPPRLDGVPGLPKWAPDAVARMLAKDPDDRPPSARAALTELEGGQTQVTAGVRPRNRRARWPWLVAGMAILGGGAGAVVAVRSRPAVVPAPPPKPIEPEKPPPPKPPEAVDYEKLRADALSVLRQAARAVEPSTRVLAGDALGEVRDAPSLPALVEQAGKDPDAEVRGHAAVAAGNIGPDAQQAASLYALEKDAPPPLRVFYTEALARAGDAEARARLAEEAAGSDLASSLRAALALADLSPPGDATAVARLTALAAREAELSRVAPYAGAVILSKLGRLRVEKARALLMAGLENDDEQARLAAAEGLARLGDDGGRALAKKVLADEASKNRLVAASILAALGDYSGFSLLSTKLEDPDPATRRLAARTLGQIGEKTSARALAAHLTDGDPAVRVAAATALVTLVGLDPGLLAQASVDWAKGALSSQDWAVRAGAASLVGDVRERDGMVLLAQALADPSPEVRQAAAAGAKKLKGARAARALAAAARVEKDAPTKERIVRSLGGKSTEAPEAKAALEHISEEKSRAGVLAAGALAKIGDAGARARVEAAIADRDDSLRAAAVEAASWAGLVPSLTAAIDDRVFEVRLLAAETLAGLGSPPAAALAVLKEALDKPDASLRARGAAALLRAGEKIEGAALAAELIASPEVEARRAALGLVAALPPAEALPLARRALFDGDAGVRQAALSLAGDLAAKDREGAVALVKLALRDADDGVRARAQALLAGLLEPILPPEAADVAAMRAALDEVKAARDEAAAARATVDAQIAELSKATASPPAGEEALEPVKRLVDKIEAGAAASAAARVRAELALGRAEAAGGDQPAADAQAVLVDARAAVDEAYAASGAAQDAATAAGKKARGWLSTDLGGDATTAIAAAEASLAAGKLAEARKDLDRAAKLLRAEGKDRLVLEYAYAELYDRQAAHERADGARRNLLEKAKKSYDTYAAKGTGARAAAARARSEEIAEELKEMPSP